MRHDWLACKLESSRSPVSETCAGDYAERVVMMS